MTFAELLPQNIRVVGAELKFYLFNIEKKCNLALSNRIEKI